jgi:hypothetical protein
MAEYRGLPTYPVDVDALVTLSLLPLVLTSAALFSFARLWRFPAMGESLAVRYESNIIPIKRAL